MRNINLLGARQKPNRHQLKRLGEILHNKNWNVFYSIHSEIDPVLRERRKREEELFSN